MFRGTFRLTDDLCIPKNSLFGKFTAINNIQYVKLLKRTEANTEVLYMLCPWSFIVQTTHRSPNLSVGLIFRALIP